MLLNLTLPLESALLDLSQQLNTIHVQCGTELDVLLRKKGKAKEIESAIDEAQTIEHTLLVKLVASCRAQGIEIRLATLLKLTDVYAPELAPRIRSERLESILAEIKFKQEQSLYNSYTSTNSTLSTPSRSSNPAYTSKNGADGLNFKDEWKEINQQLSAITSVGFSMAAVGTGIWWVSAGSHFTPRLLLSLTGAFLICIVEAILYYRFFTREKPPPKKIKSKKRVFEGELPPSVEEKLHDRGLPILKFE